MSVLDHYTFTRSLSVLSSPSLAALLSCSLCSQPLSSTTALSSGKCPHAICQDCLSSHPGGACPVSGCDIPAHTKDYQENRTLGQLARCLGNIKTLMENKTILGDDTNEKGDGGTELKISEDDKSSSKTTTPLKTVQYNQTDTKKKVVTSKTGNKKVAAARLKENKAIVATAEPDAAIRRNTKLVTNNKESVDEKEGQAIVVPNTNNSKKTTTEKRNSRTAKTENVAQVDNSDIDQGNVKTDKAEISKAVDKPVDKKAIAEKPTIKKPGQSRLSLPDGKKTKKGRVRAATTSGQPVASFNTTLNQSTSTGVSSLEKKNKKGETPLHAACAKGCLATVQSLLAQGASPNTQDNAGWTPLHEAATGGRLDLARLLLEAGARPSVPSKDDRVTALHDAVVSGQLELVRLLVAKGADRDARDSKGNTPRDIAGRLGDEMVEVIENTVVEVQEEDIMETSLEPQDMVLCLSKKVAADTKQVKMLTETAVRMGCRKPSTQLSEEMTHLLVEGEEEEDSLHFLTALVVGAEIVSTSWLFESGTQGKLVNCLQFRCEGKGEEGAKKARVRRASKQPGLLAGLHFYLTGVFDPPCLTKVEVQNIVRMAGGKLITREPDPEFIPSQEATVPHHTKTSSCMASTSHVILYMAGSKREPMMKYNMKHVKTLPVSWLVACITNGSVVEPQ